jgi:pantothenate kinase-related protein Tda10
MLRNLNIQRFFLVVSLLCVTLSFFAVVANHLDVFNTQNQLVTMIRQVLIPVTFIASVVGIYLTWLHASKASQEPSVLRELPSYLQPLLRDVILIFSSILAGLSLYLHAGFDLWSWAFAITLINVMLLWQVSNAFDRALRNANQPQANQDLLNRGLFVDRLMRMLGNWNGNESLVVSVEGPWGSGKTFLKDLIVNHPNKTKFKIMEFSPWQWPEVSAMREALLRELARTVTEANSSGTSVVRAFLVWMGAQFNQQRTAAALRRYAKYLDAGAAPMANFSNSVMAIAAIIPLVTVLASGNLIPNGWLKTVFERFSPVLVLVSVFSVLQAIIGVWVLLTENRLPTAQEQKQNIQRQLLRLNQPILVVIDDLDRLTSEEIRKVFSLIKADADFPKVVFLLMFDREIVTKALEHFYPEKTNEYLEKFVQLQLAMPQPSTATVRQILTDRLVFVFNELQPNAVTNSQVVAWLKPGLPYIENLRDVNRFCDALKFQVQLFQTTVPDTSQVNGPARQVLEVNAQDLVRLEILRLFESDLYSKLFLEKELLTGRLNVSYKELRARERMSVLLSQSKTPEFADELLSELFPAASWTLEANHSPPQGFNFNLDLKVGGFSNFDRYFQLAIPQNDVSQTSVLEAIRASPYQQEFARILNQHYQMGTLSALLFRLQLNVDNFEQGHHSSILGALFGFENVLQGHANAPKLDEISTLAYVFVKEKLLKNMTSDLPELRAAIANSDALFSPIFVIQVLEDNVGIEFPSLMTEWLKKVKTASDADVLRNHERSRIFLNTWIKRGDRTEAEMGIKKQLEKREGFVDAASVALNQSVVSKVDLKVMWDQLNVSAPTPEEVHLKEFLEKP